MSSEYKYKYSSGRQFRMLVTGTGPYEMKSLDGDEDSDTISLDESLLKLKYKYNLFRTFFRIYYRNIFFNLTQSNKSLVSSNILSASVESDAKEHVLNSSIDQSRFVGFFCFNIFIILLSKS